MSAVDSPDTATSAVRLKTATVTQYLASESRRFSPGKRRAVLLRAAPVWDGPAEVVFGDRQARVAAAPSPLAVYELVLEHLAAGTEAAPGGDVPEVLVVLTDREETELGPDVLAKVYRQRVNAVDAWDVVRQSFGARHPDHRLFTENWAAEALLDAAPPGGWPQVAGGPLTRGRALGELTLRRLGIGRYDPERGAYGLGPGADGGVLDTHTLLRWSLTPGGPDRFLALRGPEREGIARFVGEKEQAGATGRALLALVEAEHGPDAVAFGLVCAALWVHAEESEDAEDYRARGRVERWFGDELPAQGKELDALVAAFGRSCEEFVTAQLQAGRSDFDEGAGQAARRLTSAVLESAAGLVRQFGAERAAALSPVLGVGLEARFTAVGEALADGDAKRVAAAVRALKKHRLAVDGDSRARIERARMAQRLAQWLATEPTVGTETVPDGIDRHIDETGWVDLALEHIEAGGDPDPVLKSAYDALCASVRERRRAVDEHFARLLAAWTAAGTDPGAMLTVESFLSRVVAPVVKAADRRVLLLVLDGMSAAIAAELGEQLREKWAEYDPVPGAKDDPRRRAMAAALPTVTAVSRTSLFAGRLTTGSQADEKRLFPVHRFWGGRRLAVFHKDDLRGESAGAAFGPGLSEALADDRTHVAVVLNTVDDRLGKEQKLGDGAWRLDQIGKLQDLLQTAARQGMAVIVTSDHGHVVDRYGKKVDPAGEAQSARHRTPGGPLAAAEVALSGPRVVFPEPGGDIVALWDADSRYTARKAGYHGGASLAEFTIPVLALLPFGATPPKSWRELGSQQPSWWTSAGRAAERSSAEDRIAGSAPAPVASARAAKRRREEAERAAAGEQSLFEVQEPTATAATDPAASTRGPETGQDGLVRALLNSEVFEAQVQLLARKPPLPRIETAIHALLEAGGTLPVSALGQRVGLPPLRATGFAAVLRQLLNHDGVQVLETLPDGRTLRLHPSLLKAQFEIR